MRNLWAEAATDITPEEWVQLATAFAGTKHAGTIAKLQERGNVASKASDVLDPTVINQGHEQINAALREKGLPFRLTRAEPFVTNSNTKPRGDRLIAFVRWDNGNGCAVNPPRHGDCAP